MKIASYLFSRSGSVEQCKFDMSFKYSTYHNHTCFLSTLLQYVIWNHVKACIRIMQKHQSKSTPMWRWQCCSHLKPNFLRNHFFSQKNIHTAIECFNLLMHACLGLYTCTCPFAKDSEATKGYDLILNCILNVYDIWFWKLYLKSNMYMYIYLHCNSAYPSSSYTSYKSCYY